MPERADKFEIKWFHLGADIDNSIPSRGIPEDADKILSDITSNKSFIGKSLDSDIDGRIEGTIASNVAAYLGGVSIFRVHNVKEHKKAFEIARRIKNV